MKLSVIIPTRNRANILEKALNSIVCQTLPCNKYEVIVVDNGSTDNTKAIISGFTGKIEELVYIYDENPGLHIGRHRGVLASKADILVFGDDDIEAFPTWLEGILNSFEDQSVVLVGGKNLPNFESTPPSWVIEMWESGGKRKKLGYLSILDFGDEIQEINPYYVFGCNFSIRKSVLLEAGGFHPDGMPQDMIKYRGDGESYVSRFVMNKGYKTIYNPKASVYHLCSSSRMTREYFARRAFNQGVSDSYRDVRDSVRRSMIKEKFNFLIKKYILGKDVWLESEYFAGYQYHQDELKRDKSLFDWVKRDSYINNGRIK